MKTNIHTNEQNTQTRQELAMRYFGAVDDIPFDQNYIVQRYAEGNLGLVALLSDLQEFINMEVKGGQADKEHYRVIINDIKCILINDLKPKKKDE